MENRESYKSAEKVLLLQAAQRVLDALDAVSLPDNACAGCGRAVRLCGEDCPAEALSAAIYAAAGPRVRRVAIARVEVAR